jgi:hypothetical protein
LSAQELGASGLEESLWSSPWHCAVEIDMARSWAQARNVIGGMSGSDAENDLVDNAAVEAAEVAVAADVVTGADDDV